MGTVIGIPLLALLAVVQSSLLSHMRLLDGRPDLVLLAVVGWALGGRSRDALVWAFIGGIFLDLLSELPLGVSSASLVIIALVVTVSEGNFWGAHPLLQLAAVLIASVMLYAFMLAALFLQGHPFDLQLSLSQVVLPSVFLNMLLALPATQLSEAVQGVIYPSRISP